MAEKNITPRRALDLAIRDAQDKYEYGYTIEGKGKYEYYLSNEEWSEYLKRMSVQHRAQFNDADGGELVEKNGPHGLTPPKMASFGSSSRLIYELSHDTPDFNFEKLLPTRVGGTANLDGFRRTGDMDIFVESKCGEIYDSHKKNVVSLVYQEVYEAIGAPLEYVAEEIKDDDRHRNFTFKIKGKVLDHFDIKQMICHLLGICANIYEDPKANTKIKFVYLLFNPNHITSFTEATKKREKQIKAAYDATVKEIELFGDFKWLFDAVLKYQSRLKPGKPTPQCEFSFKLVDQTNYKEEIS